MTSDHMLSFMTPVMSFHDFVIPQKVTLNGESSDEVMDAGCL